VGIASQRLKERFPLQRTETELFNSAATLANAELKTKTTLVQGILAPVREDLLNRVDFASKKQITRADQRTDQRRSKESI
jgi:hypothetical protein